MARYRITYWQEIPSQVEASSGTERARSLLSPRFQELIDATATRQGLVGTEAYLTGWRVGPVRDREGSPSEVVAAVAAELEDRYAAYQAAALSGDPR